MFYCLEETNQKFGNDKTNSIVEQFKKQMVNSSYKVKFFIGGVKDSK